MASRSAQNGACLIPSTCSAGTPVYRMNRATASPRRSSRSAWVSPSMYSPHAFWADGSSLQGASYRATLLTFGPQGPRRLQGKAAAGGMAVEEGHSSSFVDQRLDVLDLALDGV